MLLKGPPEVADSHAETGFRTAHQAEVRMPVQLPGKEPESRRDRQSRKYADGDAPRERTMALRPAALWRKRLEGGNVKTNQRGRKQADAETEETEAPARH
jgi:hypothetical protein